MRSRRALGAALIGRSQLLVVTLAILVTAPVLILGQASDSETRARDRAALIEAASHTAEAVSNSFNEREVLIRDTLASLTLSPRPDASPISLAVQRADSATLQAIADAVERLYPRYVVRAYVALRGQADTISDATIVVASPPGTGLVGHRLSDIGEPASAALRTIVGQGSIGFTGAMSDSFPDSTSVPSLTVIAASIPGDAPGDTQTQRIRAPAVLVAEVDDARTFADAARPFLALGDDAYLIDPNRRLIGRARARPDFPLLDLSGDPFVQLIGPGSSVVTRVGAVDPLGAGARLITSYPLGISPAYSILVVRDTTQIDRELDATLSQLALSRLLVVAAVVVLAYLAAVAGKQLTLRAVDGERLRLARDLHDLLGHSLSLIAIKSQLARSLLASRDNARAGTEVGDIERVARESLQDVRHAVDGYRQPTFASALASARSALAAAGIDCTVEEAAGPLPTALDATLAWAVREGVTNVIRHGHAATCSIRLTRRGDEADLEVVNDGPAVTVRPPGNGLHGLEERAAAFGGHADAGPLADGGFRLRVSLPLGAS